MKKISKPTQKLLINIAVLVVVYAVLQILISTGHVSSLIQGLLVPVCAYSIAAVGLNLCVGYLGELSLGHAGFMCIGAFTSAFFSKVYADTLPDGIRFFLAILIGAVAAAVFGFIIAIPVLRLNGDYLAIVTLAFGEIIKNVINVFYIGIDSEGLHVSMKDKASLGLLDGGSVILNGAQGITGNHKQSTFTISMILLILALVVASNFVNSRTGRAVAAIRDNRIAAETVGLPVAKFKLIAFTLSAAIAGVAGVLYSHNLSSLTATTNNFGYNMSILILVYVVLGGIGNFSGGIIATTILLLLPELLRGLQDYRMLIYSIVLIALMIFNWSPSIKKWRAVHGFTGEAVKARFSKNKEVQ